MPFVSKNASHLYIARNTHKLQLFKRTVQNSTSLADCVGPGVLQTFSTCAVNKKNKIKTLVHTDIV